MFAIHGMSQKMPFILIVSVSDQREKKCMLRFGCCHVILFKSEHCWFSITSSANLALVPKSCLKIIPFLAASSGNVYGPVPQWVLNLIMITFCA